MRRLLLAVAVLSSFAFAAPAQAAVNKAIWGPVDLPNGRSAFPTYRHLGVDTLQLGVGWANVAGTRPANPRDPGDPAYSWSGEIDKAIRRGRRSGIKIALLVTGAPGWANGGKPSNWAPRRARDFKDFVFAAAKRYPTVRRWMIWGEPDRQERFMPLPRHDPAGPRKYATLLDAAYGALKRVNRRNIVVGGMTFTNGDVYPAEFLRWMRLPNGKPPRLDEYGHNPFSTRFPDLSRDPIKGYEDTRDICDIDTLARQLRRTYRGFKQFRRRGPKLWLSEFSISSDRTNYEFDYYVSRKDQAKWLTAAYKVARRAKYVSGLGWIPLLDDSPKVERGVTTGLMEWGGKKKPAYWAYRRVP